MQERPYSDYRIQPKLPRSEVLDQSITRLLATHNGGKGSYYEIFGIELANGLIFNVSSPESAYEVDATTRDVSPGYDLYTHQPPQTQIELAGELVSLVECSSERFDDLPAPLQIESRAFKTLFTTWRENHVLIFLPFWIRATIWLIIMHSTLRNLQQRIFVTGVLA